MKKEYIETTTSSLSVNVVASHAESLRKTVETTYTVRVYKNGFIGVAGQVGKSDWSALEKQAVENLSLGIPYPDDLTSDAVEKQDTRRNIVSTDRFVKIVDSLLKKLVQVAPDFIFSNKIQYYESNTHYRNSENVDLAYCGNEMNVILCVKSKASANIIDFAVECNIDEYSEDKVVSDVKMLCDAYNNTIPLENGKYTVVAPDYLFFSDALSNFTGELYATGASLFKDMLGRKILNDHLTLESDRRNRLNVAFFDAEGTIESSDNSAIIKNGVFKRVIANKKVAAQFNLPRAIGSNASYDSVPSPGARGIGIKNTAGNLSEIIGNEKAIFILSASGGDITTSGDYATPCEVALLIENGKPVGRLPKLNLFGNIRDFLGEDFIGASDKGLFEYKTSLAVAKMNVSVI